MKETTLRNMIRKQIKESLKEAPMAKQAVGQKLGSVEKLTGIKQLKKILGQGGPAQQAAGLLRVVQAISGNNQAVAVKLAQMLMKKNSLDGDMGKPKAAADRFESIEEADEFEMSKIKGLSKSKVGSQTDIDRAAPVLQNIAKMTKDSERGLALAYLLTNAGFDKNGLIAVLPKIKTALAKYKK